MNTLISCISIGTAERCSTEGKVRLEDDTAVNEGRVEICLGGEWGAVCDDDWGASYADS